MQSAGKRRIIPFVKAQKDVRPAVIGFLKNLTLVALAVAVCGVAYTYRDDMNMENMRRFLSYMRVGISAGGAPFTEAEIAPRSASGYCAFRGGLAVLDGDMLRFLNAAGREDFTVQLKYSDPECVSNGKLLLTYSRGGKELCITNSYAKVFETTMNGDIISASMTEGGAFAVVTGQEGFRSAVTVFDRGQDEIFRVRTVDYYISRAALSPDEKHLAAAAYTGGEGEFRSSVLLYATDREEKPLAVSFGQSYIYDLRFLSSGGLCVLTENEIRVVGLSGETVYENNFESGDLAAYAFSDGGYAALVVRDGSGSGKHRLKVALENKMLEQTAVIEGEILGISAAGKTIAVVADDRLYVFSSSLDALREPEAYDGIYDALAREDGSLIILCGSKAEVLKMKD